MSYLVTALVKQFSVMGINPLLSLLIPLMAKSSKVATKKEKFGILNSDQFLPVLKNAGQMLVDFS